VDTLLTMRQCFSHHINYSTMSKTQNAGKRSSTTKPIKRDARRPTPDLSTLSPEAQKYALAIMDPFDTRAFGARVPDQFAAPTVTQTVRATLSCKANSSGDVGIAIFPNVVTSAYLFSGSGSDFASVTYGDNTTISASRWGIDASVLSAKFDNYRIVGYGVRVTGLSSMTNASGKLIMATAPINTTWITKDYPIGGVTMSTYSTDYTVANTEKAWGIPYTSTTRNPSLLVNLPQSRVVSGIELAENIFEINPKVSSPEALNFRGTSDSFIGTDVVSQSSALNARSGDASYLRLEGHEAVYLYYTGGVASTSVIDVELVYHLEGKPNLNLLLGQTGNLVPATNSLGSVVRPIEMLKVLETAAKQPAVRQVVETAAGYIHPLLGRMAGALLSI